MDSSFLGSREHMLEGWRDQFITPIFMIYDRDNFGEIIVNLPEQKVFIDGHETSISRTAAETFDEAMKGIRGWAWLRFQHEDFGIFSDSGFGYVDRGTTPMDVYESHDKDDYVWIWGSIHKNGTFLQLYGGNDYGTDWDHVVQAVKTLIS